MAAVDPPDLKALQIARDVLDSLLEGCQVIGFDYTYLYVNDTVVAQGRQSREQLLGRTMMECYAGIEAAPMFSVLRRCMIERKHDRMENEFAFPDGSTGWFELRFIPVVVARNWIPSDCEANGRSRPLVSVAQRTVRFCGDTDDGSGGESPT